MERRAFFRSLIAGGATVTERPARRNRRAHHEGERLYHGPMAIPARIAAIIAEHPAIKRTTDRHLVSRYAEAGWTWLFRCQIPEHRLMVGEIIRTPKGGTRVHCWAAADPERYTRGDEPAKIIAAKAPRNTGTLPCGAILPPLVNPPSWEQEDRIVLDSPTDLVEYS